MIENDLQYNVTKTQIDKFEKALKELEHAPPNLAVHYKFREAQKEAVRSQLEALRKEAQEYERSKRLN